MALSQGASAGSNPVRATGVLAGQRIGCRSRCRAAPARRCPRRNDPDRAEHRPMMGGGEAGHLRLPSRCAAPAHSPPSAPGRVARSRRFPRPRRSRPRLLRPAPPVPLRSPLPPSPSPRTPAASFHDEPLRLVSQRRRPSCGRDKTAASRSSAVSGDRRIERSPYRAPQIGGFLAWPVTREFILRYTPAALVTTISEYLRWHHQDFHVGGDLPEG